MDEDDIQMGDRVGGGNFGDVAKGTWRGQVEVAIKVLKEHDQEGLDMIIEGIVQKNLHHPNLLQVD